MTESRSRSPLQEIAFDRDDTATQTISIFVVPAQPDWSPDGSRILFASDRPDKRQLDLWTMKADGSDLQRVTNTPGRDEHDPVWSPDGRWIAYVAASGSNDGLYYDLSRSQLDVSHANGSGRRKITHACGNCRILNDEPSWQPLP